MRLNPFSFYFRFSPSGDGVFLVTPERLPKDGLSSDFITRIRGKTQVNGVRVQRGLPFLQGLLLGTPKNWSTTELHKNAASYFLTSSVTDSQAALITSANTVGVAPSGAHYLTALLFAGIEIALLAEILSWWHFLATSLATDPDLIRRQQRKISSSPGALEVDVEEGDGSDNSSEISDEPEAGNSCIALLKRFLSPLMLWPIFWGRWPRDRSINSRLRFWGTSFGLSTTFDSFITCMANFTFSFRHFL